MSLDTVNARIAEIEARIQALTPRPEPPARAVVAPAPSAAAGPLLGGQSGGVQPFNVALAQATGQATVRPLVGSFSPKVDALIQKYSSQYGLDPNVVRAVITAESDGDPNCISNKGAMGLMQLMPDEVKGYGLTNPFDPEQNIAGGTRQLAEKLKLFDGDLPLALAAYNAGTGAVKRYGGIPPYSETQNYVRKIMTMLGEKR